VSLVALYGRLYLLVWSVLGRSFHSYTCLTPTLIQVLKVWGITLVSQVMPYVFVFLFFFDIFPFFVLLKQQVSLQYTYKI
jgi:hypothetical protein